MGGYVGETGKILFGSGWVPCTWFAEELLCLGEVRRALSVTAVQDQNWSKITWSQKEWIWLKRGIDLEILGQDLVPGPEFFVGTFRILMVSFTGLWRQV